MESKSAPQSLNCKISSFTFLEVAIIWKRLYYNCKNMFETKNLCQWSPRKTFKLSVWKKVPPSKVEFWGYLTSRNFWFPLFMHFQLQAALKIFWRTFLSCCRYWKYSAWSGFSSACCLMCVLRRGALTKYVRKKKSTFGQQSWIYNFNFKVFRFFLEHNITSNNNNLTR